MPELIFDNGYVAFDGMIYRKRSSFRQNTGRTRKGGPELIPAVENYEIKPLTKEEEGMIEEKIIEYADAKEAPCLLTERRNSLSLWWIWIVSVRITFPDLTIPTMDK